MSHSNADHRRASFLTHAPKCAPWSVFMVLLPALTGCSEMHKYWDRSPTAPLVAREIPPPPGVAIQFPDDGQRLAAGGTLILSATAMEDGSAIEPGRITWRSSLDGPVGTGPYLRVRGLSVGAHVLTVSASGASGTIGSASVAVEVLAQPTYRFATDINGPILQLRCVSCHSPAAADWPNHHLDLRTYAGLMAGGITRAYESVAPSRPDSSLVWNKVTADPPWVGSPMPGAPNPKVPAALLEKLRVWISEGAPP